MKQKVDILDPAGTDFDALFCDLGQKEYPRHRQDESCQVLLFGEQPADGERMAANEG
jgi:hypothetical protein